MGAECFCAFGGNEGTNKKKKKTSIVQEILKWRKSKRAIIANTE